MASPGRGVAGRANARAATPLLMRLEKVNRGFEEGGRRREVLSGLSATFGRGELIVLMGRSGSGKSTLLNLISGIDLPDSGAVIIDGQDMARLSEHERTLFRRQKIGFVFQFFNLVPTLTVLENVCLPLELNGIPARPAQATARRMLEAVGLADRERSFPDRLSGGEQQRIAIARALVHDPLLVLADEPTGNLDAETGAQVLELLDTLTRRAGKTMLMVTHTHYSRQPHAQDNALDGSARLVPDRIFRLVSGQLNEEL